METKQSKIIATLAATLAITLCAAPRAALAWECLSNAAYTGGPFGCSPTACRFQGGNSLTFHIIGARFTANEADAIENAAGAWRAGAGQLNRGADWTFTRGSDTALGALNLTDGRTDVTKLSAAWFAAQGIPAGALAVAIPVYGAWPLCGVSGVDVVFNDSFSWSTVLPAATTGGDFSIGQVAIHELGHVVGFGHEDDDLASMNAFYPCGGDPSGSFRINEMDYVGLRDNFSDSSTGKNLMLDKFEHTGPGTSREVWTGATVTTSPGATLTGGDVPEDIAVLLTGTTSLNNVKISWFLRPVASGGCGGAGSVLLGSKTLTLGVAIPFPQGLATWTVPLGTAAGDYFVCASVDPDLAVSETREDDNTVHGERVYTVN